MRTHALIAAALLACASAHAAPYATTYHGTIAHSQIPADAPDGAAFTLTLVFGDQGGGSAASQRWDVSDVTCGFWRWRVDATRSVAVALDFSGSGSGFLGHGSAATNAAGTLTEMFDSISSGPMAWADFDVSGLAPGDSIGWGADGMPQVFGLMRGGGGGSFDDGAGTPAGGVAMAPARWSAPLPFTGACDASAEPPVAHAIGTSVTPSGGGTLNCPATALHGTSAHCTAQPATGYSTQSIDGCGGTATGAGVNGYDTGAITGACTVTARFTRNAYAITASATPTEGGTLTCPATALHGSSAHCTAQPATGYSTQSIDGCNGAATGAGVNGYDTGAITGACTVTAHFTRNAYAIATSVTPADGGTLDCPATVAHGGDAVCRATAAAGFGFSHFTGCDGASGAACTLTGVQGPRSVGAVFAPITRYQGTTVPASGAGGPGSAAFTGGGAACRFDLSATGFLAAPVAPPPGQALPQGMFRFKLVGCDKGGTVTMQVNWPQPINGYAKYGPEAKNAPPRWFTPDGLAVSGNTARFTVQDGQRGDDDGEANGEIADPSGPVAFIAPAAGVAIPALGPWGLALLAGLLGALGWRRRG